MSLVVSLFVRNNSIITAFPGNLTFLFSPSRLSLHCVNHLFAQERSHTSACTVRSVSRIRGLATLIFVCTLVKRHVAVHIVGRHSLRNKYVDSGSFHVNECLYLNKIHFLNLMQDID